MLVEPILINKYNLKKKILILVRNSSSLPVNQVSNNDFEEQSSDWYCSQCTFLNNTSNEKCDMCSLEKNTLS